MEAVSFSIRVPGVDKRASVLHAVRKWRRTRKGSLLHGNPVFVESGEVEYSGSVHASMKAIQGDAASLSGYLQVRLRLPHTPVVLVTPF
jgi:hypothetical protein